MGKASRRKKIPQSFVATQPASLSNLPFAPGSNQYGKISASLLDLIDPYADDDLPLETMRKLVGMGVVAWNIASTSNTLDEGAAELDRFISDTPALGASAGTAAQDFRVAVLGLVRRKRLLFPRINGSWPHMSSVVNAPDSICAQRLCSTDRQVLHCHPDPRVNRPSLRKS